MEQDEVKIRQLGDTFYEEIDLKGGRYKAYIELIKNHVALHGHIGLDNLKFEALFPNKGFPYICVHIDFQEFMQSLTRLNPEISDYLEP